MTQPTTTHFAVLGLLAIRPWSTYELIHYLRGSYVHQFWSKTEGRLYETPKELVGFGYATSSKHRISDAPTAKGRQRTVYTITRAGRAALRAWLNAPSAPPSFEIEALLKLAYADQGTLDDFLKRIDGLQRDLATSANPEGLASAAESPKLPPRHHLSAFMADLSDRIAWTVWEWLAELRAEAEGWESTKSSPQQLERANERYRSILRRAQRRS